METLPPTPAGASYPISPPAYSPPSSDFQTQSTPYPAPSYPNPAFSGASTSGAVPQQQQPFEKYPPPSDAYQTQQYPPQQVIGAPANQQPQMVQTTTVVTTTTKKEPSQIRKAIPELPLPLAIVLLVVNCLLPGVGTIIAGFSVFCCGNIGESGGSKFGTFCINFWVGLAQLFTVVGFLFGWVWSILWGIAFVTIAGGAGKKTTTTYVTSTQPTSNVAYVPNNADQEITIEEGKVPINDLHTN